MKIRGRAALLFVLTTATAGISLTVQRPATKKPAFDVISVKPDSAGGPPRRTGTEGNRFIAENVPLIILIQYAYRGAAGGMSRDQVIGGPSWINTDRFDIEAKVDGNIRAIPTQQTWLMVQSLLEDRFKLRAHSETRILPVYNLTVSKRGIQMKVSQDQTLPTYDDNGAPPNPTFSLPRGELMTTPRPSGETVIVGLSIPISPNLASRRAHALLPNSLIGVLWGYSGRSVIDQTGLKGLYDFRLQFVPTTLSASPDTAADNPSGPSLFSAVETQLGLKLESAKGPVDVLVIDSVGRPSVN